MRKRFVTVFGKTANEHLLKDVGMIPFILGQEFNYDSKIATCKMPGKYSYMYNEVKGLNIEFFKKYFNSVWLSEWLYIFKKSRQIDILNLYHLDLKTCLKIFTYKVRNRKGFLYLKLDVDCRFLIGKSANNALKKYIYKRTMKYVDLCSAESKKACRMMTEYLGKNIVLIPNGCFAPDDELPVFTNKEKIILTVARLGSFQKNSEALLEAFVASGGGGWKLKLVGDATEEFMHYLNETRKQNPNLSEFIEYVGCVSDKEDLQKLYEEASVFILPSRWESFGLVLVEALCGGCYLVTTDEVMPAEDLIINESVGEIYPLGNQDSLNNIVKKIVSGEKSFTMQEIKYRRDLGKKKADWAVILDTLYKEKKQPNGGLREKRILKGGVIVSVGRMGAKQKNMNFLLKAFALSSSRQDFILLLIGPSDESFIQSLKKYLQIHPNISTRVFYVGAHYDKEVLNRFYNVADIFVLPSRWEGFPLSMMEALSFGNYLILTNKIYPAYDIIEDDMIGMIVESENTQMLANAIAEVYSSLHRIRKNIETRKQIAQKYKWKTIGERINKYLC